MQTFPHEWSDSDKRPGFYNICRQVMSNFIYKFSTPCEPAKLHLSKVGHSKEKYSWLGHSSLLLRLNCLSILIDPCFYNLPFNRRKLSILGDVEELGKIDILLISHLHRDHCDFMTIRQIIQINPNVIIMCGKGSRRQLRCLQHDAIVEATWHESYPLFNDVKITFLPAVHCSRLGLFDSNKSLWGSFLIQEGNSQSIFYAGDTAYGKHFKEIREKYGHIKMAILPIGAYLPRHTMKYYHMSPIEALNGFKDLKADYLIPVHHGTYRLGNEEIFEPIMLLWDQMSMSGLLGRLLIPDEMKYLGEHFNQKL